jgi:hypothetical protein
MTTHNLVFDDNDLQILNDALMLLPYGKVAPLVVKINLQLAKEQVSSTPEEALAA